MLFQTCLNSFLLQNTILKSFGPHWKKFGWVNNDNFSFWVNITLNERRLNSVLQCLFAIKLTGLKKLLRGSINVYKLFKCSYIKCTKNKDVQHFYYQGYQLIGRPSNFVLKSTMLGTSDHCHSGHYQGPIVKGPVTNFSFQSWMYWSCKQSLCIIATNWINTSV